MNTAPSIRFRDGVQEDVLAQVDHGARLGTLARSLRRPQGLILDVVAQRSGRRP